MNDELPIALFNPKNCYELLDGHYIHQGIFMFILAPLFFGLCEEDLFNDGVLEISVIVLYIVYSLYVAYSTTHKRCADTDFRKI